MAVTLHLKPNAEMLTRVQDEVATGKYFFVPLADLDERIAIPEDEKAEDLERITDVFLATHVLIEKAALRQRGRSTYIVETNSGLETCYRPLTLAQSIDHVKARSGAQRDSDDTIRIFKIVAHKGE
jgi:hypothetical protein